MSKMRTFLPFSGSVPEEPALRLARRIGEHVDMVIDLAFLTRTLHPLTNLEKDDFDRARQNEGLDRANKVLEQFYRDKHAAKAGEARALFDRFVASGKQGTRFTWQQQEDVFQDTQPLILHASLLHDLTIASFELAAPMSTEVVETALLSTGRPVLFVAGAEHENSDLVVAVAWKPAAATIHAVTAAMPLLRAVSRCLVVTVTEDGRWDGPTAAEFAAYLKAVGVSAEPIELEPGEQSPQGALEALYRRESVDVLVMGAYTQSRLKQLILGGFTKHFLTSRSCNVLMTA